MYPVNTVALKCTTHQQTQKKKKMQQQIQKNNFIDTEG